MRFVLGSRGYAPWARLTFMIYLIHLNIIEWFFAQSRQALYLSYKPIFWNYASMLLVSCLLSIPLSAMFEAPFMNIEKLLIFPPKNKKKQEQIKYEPKEEIKQVSQTTEPDLMNSNEIKFMNSNEIKLMTSDDANYHNQQSSTFENTNFHFHKLSERETNKFDE